MRVLVLNSFCVITLNFHRAYLDNYWRIHTVALAGVGILLMADIPVYGMMEKLQRSCPKRHDELVEMLGIYPNCRMHQLRGGHRRHMCADSYWSDTTVQDAFIR